MMDNKAYKALKSDKNPNITFTAATLPLGKSNVTGKLTIAAVSYTHLDVYKRQYCLISDI